MSYQTSMNINSFALMNDGRNFSNWQPESAINEKMQKNAGIKSNWDYRQYLQKNAHNIMKYNHMESIISSGNNSNTYSTEYNNSSNNSPFIFGSTHDKRIPNFGFNNSDLKQTYLSREQLNARLVSPSISTANFS